MPTRGGAQVKVRRRLLSALAAPIPVLALAAAPSYAAAAPSQVATPRVALSGDVVGAVSHSTRLGDLAANAPVSVAVTLAPRPGRAQRVHRGGQRPQEPAVRQVRHTR